MGKDLFAELCGDPGVICQVQTDQIGQLGQGRIINFFVKPALPDPEAEIKNGKAYVSVRDYGETIPPDDLPFIFDRFHKSDRSRSLDKDGVGLGLYLVKSIINSHDEDIAVTSRDGMTEFVFTLALAKNEVGEKKTNLF